MLAGRAGRGFSLCRGMEAGTFGDIEGIHDTLGEGEAVHRGYLSPGHKHLWERQTLTK